MFNTTIHKHDSGPKYVNVTERRAPTDESVRLLSEFEKAANDRVLARGRIENNVVSAKWFLRHACGDPDDRTLTVIMTLNGTESRTDIQLAYRYYDRDKIAIKIRDAVRDMVADRVLGSLLDQITLPEILGR